jgi:hypothetical protein
MEEAGFVVNQGFSRYECIERGKTAWMFKKE